MLYTATTKPLSTSQFYVDFKKIFFKDQKIETRLFIFKCFAPCQVDLWAETLPFNRFTSRENANFLSCHFFYTLACVASVSNRVIARKLERSNFLDEPREETLATQAIHTHVLPHHSKAQLLRYCGKRSFLGGSWLEQPAWQAFKGEGEGGIWAR